MNEEAALALGATKWEMVRTSVLPYGKPGVIAAVMLGLGRALGETIALAMTLGIVFDISSTSSRTAATASPPTSPTPSARPTTPAAAR